MKNLNSCQQEILNCINEFDTPNYLKVSDIYSKLPNYSTDEIDKNIKFMDSFHLFSNVIYYDDGPKEIFKK